MSVVSAGHERADAVSALVLARPAECQGRIRDMNARAAARTLRRWVRAEDGQDLLEYALLVALIVIVAISAVTTVGTTIKTVFWDAISAASSSI